MKTYYSVIGYKSQETKRLVLFLWEERNGIVLFTFDPILKLEAIAETNKDPELSDKAKRVYICLITRYNNRTKQCNPSVETIAKDVGAVSTRTVERKLQELREKEYITNFRGFPSKGSNMYQLKHSRAGLLKKKSKTTKLTDLYDNIVGQTPSSMSCKTMNESMKETMNINENNNLSDESELLGDSLSDTKDNSNNDDTKVESLVVKDSDKESITKERFYEIFFFLDKKDK